MCVIKALCLRWQLYVVFWAYSNQKLNFETVTETPIYLSSFIKMIFDNEIDQSIDRGKGYEYHASRALI